MALKGVGGVDVQLTIFGQRFAGALLALVLVVLVIKDHRLLY